MEFFNGIKTLEELKAEFKKLASKHHPDRGGDTATMQKVNAEYDQAMKIIINGSDECHYKKTNKTEGYSFWEDKEEHTEVEKKVKEALDAIIGLDGLIIEIIGVWIYVRGETKQHKEILKTNKFFFRKKDEDCFWVFMGKKSGGRGTMSLDEMREKYGSEKVAQTKSKKSKIEKI